MLGIEQFDESSQVSEFSCLLNGGRSSLSYQRLQDHRFKLSILKLDGSSFDVYVARNATVEELKRSVEEPFVSMPSKGSEDRISWSHVWGHFCLCYEGQKLIKDKAYIRTYGIRDGDQLQFIHHISINNFGPLKQQPGEGSVAFRWCTRSSAGSNGYVNDDDYTNEDESSTDEPCQYERHQISAPKFKLARFLSNRFSCSKLRSCARKRTLGRSYTLPLGK